MAADSLFLIEDFADRHPESFARVASRATAAEVIAVLERLPPASRAGLVARLPSTLIDGIIDGVPEFAKQWLAAAPVTSAGELLSRLPRERRLAIVKAIDDPAQRQRLLRQQRFPVHTIGNLVVDVPIRVVETARTADVVRALRELGDKDPGLLIVVSPSGQYTGVLDPWPLFTTAPAPTLGRYIRKVTPLLPEMASADIADDERWNEHAWLPVVDIEQRVLGRVARARVLRAARDQTVETLRRNDLVSSLFSELVFLLGSLLERVLSAPRSR